MKRFLKYTSIVLGSLMVLIVGLGYFFVISYEKEIIHSVVTELNREIETKVDVKDIQFTIFRHFPMATVEFKDVLIHSPKSFLKANPKQDTLVWAKNIYLEFNIWDVYQANYILKQLQLKDAIVKMYIDRKGEDNFHFTKPSNDSLSTKFSIDLSKVILTRVDYQFNNAILSSQFKLFANKFALKGNLSDDEFGLTTSGSLKLNKIEINKINYLMHPETSLNIDLLVNNSKVEIKKGSLRFGDEYLNLKGSYWFDNQSFIDIEASSNQMTFQNIFEQMPKDYRSAIENYQVDGKIAFEMLIKGEISKNHSPNIEINAFVNEAEILNTNNQIPLKQLSFNARFVSARSLFELRGLRAQLYESFIKGQFTVQDFVHPKMSSNFQIESDLKEIKQFFEFDSLQNFQGKLKADLRLSGQMQSPNNLTKADIRTFVTSGTIQVEDALVEFLDKQKRNFHHLNANLQLDNNNFMIENLDVRFGQSKANIKGKAYNVLAFMLLDDERLNVNGSVYCDTLYLEDILNQEYKIDGTPIETEIDTFIYPQNIATRLQFEVGHLVYKKFTADQVYAQFYMDETHTKIEDFRMNTSGGKATGQAYITPLPNKNYDLALSSNFQNIDIDKIMFQLDNFGQTAIDYTNLKGKLNAITQMKASINPDFTIQKESLTAISNFNILNGELNHYKPLYKLSKFVDLKALENIKFEKLENTLEIKNNQIHFPKMAIQSSALDLNASGDHNFSNEYTYRINLLLSDVLGKKAKENNRGNDEFSFIEDDGTGKTSLFLVIEGNGDDMKIRYDTKSVKEHIKEGIQEEKSNLKTLLNEEFGWFKKDSTVIKHQQKEAKTKTKENFQIEWEDE